MVFNMVSTLIKASLAIGLISLGTTAGLLGAHEIQQIQAERSFSIEKEHDEIDKRMAKAPVTTDPTQLDSKPAATQASTPAPTYHAPASSSAPAAPKPSYVPPAPVPTFNYNIKPITTTIPTYNAPVTCNTTYHYGSDSTTCY